MNRLKTFAKYILLIILFYVFSNLIMFFCINTNYKNLNQKNSIPDQINITTASATLVNGKIRGTISSKDSISDKYIKFNFYNNSDNLSAIKYIKVSDIKDNEFEFYFRLQYIESYSVEIVDNVENDDITSYETYFSFEQYRKYKIIYWFVLLLFI